jgi:hypothetical protein
VILSFFTLFFQFCTLTKPGLLMWKTWSLEIQINEHSNMEWLQDDVEGMISGNTDKWTFEHGMTTRRHGRHELWKYRQMDIRTWNDYKTTGKTWSLEIQINEHSNMEWLQDNGGIHDLCGHSNMEWLQDDVEDMISGNKRQIDIRTWNDHKTMWKTWSLEIQTNRHSNMELLQDNGGDMISGNTDK